MQLREGPKPYHTDHNIVYSCQYHIIFCPKYRRPVLGGAVGERFKELVLAKQDEYGYTLLQSEVMPDHVHVLLDVDPRIGIASVVAKIKGYTYKNKSNQRRHWGHRQHYSTIEIVGISRG